MNTERNAEIITRGHYATESHFVVRMGEPDGVETTLAIRRVIREGNTRGTTREELQIEVTIAKHGDKRTSKAFGTIIATPQIADMNALAAWMCYSNFLNRLNLGQVEADYAGIL